LRLVFAWAAAVIALTVFLQGCGVGEYNERFQERGNALRYGDY
jgi:hypothetical protein